MCVCGRGGVFGVYEIISPDVPLSWRIIMMPCKPPTLSPSGASAQENLRPGAHHLRTRRLPLQASGSPRLAALARPRAKLDTGTKAPDHQTQPHPGGSPGQAGANHPQHQGSPITGPRNLILFCDTKSWNWGGGLHPCTTGCNSLTT